MYLNVKIAQNLALRKGVNPGFAGIFGFFFGFIAWIYYWSLPYPGELHKIFPSDFDENNNRMVSL